MTRDPDSPLSALVAIHQALIRRADPDEPAGALYPRAGDARYGWWPSFELTPYRAADPGELDLGGVESFHDLASGQIQAAIRRVFDIEGPLHFDLLGDRILAAAGAGRMGRRIRERIENELEDLRAAGEIEQSGEYWARPRQFLRPPYRDWSDVEDKHRKLEYVAPSELMVCLFHAVLDDEGAGIDDVMNRGIYAIGFPRLTASARERLEEPIQALCDRGVFHEIGGCLYLAKDFFLR